MKQQFLYVLLLGLSLILPSQVFATDHSATAPKFGLHGILLGKHTDTKKSFSLYEAEFTVSQALSSTIDGFAQAGFHKASSGENVFRLEEAYLQFSDLWSLVDSKSSNHPIFTATAGRKLLTVGTVNHKHNYQRSFVDRSIATKQFLGSSRGLSGEGVAISTKTPLLNSDINFSHIEVGLWNSVTENALHAGAMAHDDRILNIRFSNNYTLSESQSIQLGVNSLNSNISSAKANQHHLTSVDLGYTTRFSEDSSLELLIEHYMANFTADLSSLGLGTRLGKNEQTGSFVSALYSPNKDMTYGIRYSQLSQYSILPQKPTQLSLLAIKRLNPSTQLKAQYNTGDETESTIFAELLFSLGS